MNHVVAVGIYEPTWERAGRRLAGPDEDTFTMAVAAGRAAVSASAATVDRVVVVSAEPEYLDGAPLLVVARGIGLADDVALELRVGGPGTALDAVASGRPGTLVIGVSLTPHAVAAAALIGDHGGLFLSESRRIAHGLPVRVRSAGATEPADYGDPRVERELGWRRVVAELRGPAELPALVGIARGDVKRLGARSATEFGGAAGAIVALADIADSAVPDRLIAVDAATGAGVTATPEGEVTVARDVRPGVNADTRPRLRGSAMTIPLSMPSYARAFDTKLSLVAQRCSQCGVDAYPWRERCIECGNVDGGEPVVLPRKGEVYSCVTVHVPIPGVPTPRGLVIVALPPSTVRVLAHVTDTPEETAIGIPGDLVLRLVAVREGVPDYGYGFRPAVNQ